MGNNKRIIVKGDGGKWHSVIGDIPSFDGFTKDKLIAYIAEHTKYLIENQSADPYSQDNVDTEQRRIDAAKAKLKAMGGGTTGSGTTDTDSSGGGNGMSTKMKWIIGASIGVVAVTIGLIFAFTRKK